MSILEPTVIEPGSSPAALRPSALGSVLVIDDEEIFGNALSALLKAEGFDAVVARSGKEGVDWLRRRQFDVAIADLMMPGMNGIQTVAALKEVDPNGEVIILTGHATVNSTIAALRQGACDCLLKPIGIAELRPALLRAMEKRRGESARAEKAAQESEAKLQAIFDGVEAGIFLIDPEKHRIVDANPLALRLVGAPYEHVVGAVCHKFVCPADQGRCPFTDLGQKVDNSERVLLTATGERLPIIKTVRRVVIAGRPLLLESFFDISARKQAEGALRESEDRYRDLVENSTIVIGTHDAQGRILNLNRTAARLLEAPNVEETVGRSLTNYVPTDLLPQFDEYLKTILREGHAEGLMVLVTPSGKTKIVEYRNTLRRQDAQEPIVRWTGQDVTDRIQAQKAQAFLASLVESSRDAIIGKTLEGNIVSWNHGAEQLYGYRLAEVVDKSISLLAPPDRTEELAPLLEKVRRGEQISGYETARVRKDGRVVDVSLTISPVLDTTRMITGVVTIARDITERKQAERQTRLQTAALESAANGIMIADRQGRILWVNPAFTRLTGYSALEVIGQNPRVLKSGRHDTVFYQKLWDTVLSGEVWQGEIVNRHKDGTLYTEEMTITPVRDSSGAISHFIAIKQDITERKRAEDTMAERHRLAKLLADVGVALTGAESLRQGLQQCAEILVRDIDAAFARVWTVNDADKVLELQASAGMYTHIDGGHARVPIGKFKIGRIAESGEPHLTNSVGEDSWVGDQNWARREGMVAFAGHPLKVEGRVLGVVAAFARKPLTEATLQGFASVASNIAQFIRRKRAEEALRKSEEGYRLLFEQNLAGVFRCTTDGQLIDCNTTYARILGYNSRQEAMEHVKYAGLHDPIDLKIIQTRLIKSCLANRSALTSINVRLRHKDQTPVWVLGNVSMIESGEGKEPLISGTLIDITKHKQAEETLAQERDLLRSLMDYVPDFIYFKDRESRFLRINAALAKGFGLSEPAQALGKTDFDFFTAEHAQPAYDDEQGVIRTGRPLGPKEEKETWPDGRVTWASTTKLPLRDAFGNIIGTFGVSRDITDRKQAEAELYQSRQMLQSILDNIPQRVFWKDRNITYLGCNRAFAMDAGLQDPAEIIGKNDFELAWRKSAELNRADDKLVMEQGSAKLNFEERLSRPDGSLMWLRTSKLPLRDHAGRVIGVIGTYEDITVRMQAEEKVRESNELVNLLLDSVPEAVYGIDMQGNCTFCNPACLQLLGYGGADDLLGKNMHDLLHHTRQDGTPYPVEECHIFEAFRRGLGTHVDDEVLWRRDGTCFPAEYWSHPIHRQGNAIGTVVTFVDITERKRAEQQTRLQTAALESAANGIAIADLRGQILWINPAFTRLTGYSEAEILGQTVRILKSGQQNDALYQSLWRTILSGEVWQGELINRRKDGTLYTDFTTITPVRDARGTLTHFVAIKQDFTERRRAERALEERTAYLNTLFEISPFGIVVLDTRGHIQMSNSAFEKLFQYSRPEISGAKLDEVIVPKGLASEAKSLTSFCTSGPGVFLTSHRLRKDSTLVDVDIYGVPLIIEGELLGVLALYQDITQRKRAEADLVKYAEDLEVSRAAQEEHAKELARLVEELARERDLLGTLMDNLPDFIFYKDGQGRLLRTNPAHAKALGLSDPREAVGKTDFDFFPESDARGYLRDEQQVVETGQPLIGKIERARQHDGQYRWYLTTKMPIRDAQGQVIGLVGISRDMTERMQAEETLRASEERYRELFENASDIVYTTGMDTRMTSLNRVGQQVLGYSAEEATQLDLRQVVVPKHWEFIQRSRERLRAGDSDITFEVEVITKDGRQMMLEVKPRMIYRGGKPVGVQGIARDITGRDAAELELRHAQKLESVGRLASGIAHEINTPIQFVGDNTRFLQDSFGGLQTLLTQYQELRQAADSGQLDPELLAKVREVEEESDCAYLLEEIPKALTQTLDGVTRVATIVRAMKEFAHPEGKEMAAADLNKAILSTLTVARNELKYVAGVETDLGDLPLVVCNIGDLNQVFLNLLVNAAHAIAESTKGTGGKGKIQVRTASEGSTVLVTISDTGCGIPEANRTKVFDPFFTTKEVGRGTGQGLAIARSVVVDRHKGTLTFESEVGKGTTFHIRLPIDPGQCSKETKTP